MRQTELELPLAEMSHPVYVESLVMSPGVTPVPPPLTNGVLPFNCQKLLTTGALCQSVAPTSPPTCSSLGSQVIVPVLKELVMLPPTW